MYADLLNKLLKKHQLKEGQTFRIRYSNGLYSKPFTLTEIADEILNKKITGDERIAAYPTTDYFPIASHPLFYDLLFALLEQEDIAPEQKEDITRVLTDSDIPKPAAPKKRKKGATPSKIIPKSQLDLFNRSEKNASPDITEEEREVEPAEKKTPANIRRFFIGALFILFVSAAILFVLFVPQKGKKTPDVTSSPKTYLLIRPLAEAASQANPSKAKTFFDKAKEIYPKDTVRSYKQAIEYLYQALKYVDGDPAALAMLAKSYLQLWELTKKDESVVQQILSFLNSDHIEILQAKALLAVKKGEYDTAKTLLETIITKNPYHGESYLIQGELFLNAGYTNKAKDALEKALELDPGLARAHYLLGMTFKKMNQPEKAYETFWIGLNSHPEHSLSRLEASLIGIQTFNALKKAEGNLRIVIQFPSFLIPSELARAHYHLGWIYQEHKQIDFALKEYKHAIDLNPQPLYQTAYEKLGGDKALPSDIFDKGIDEESLYFVSIGDRYAAEQQYTDAIAQYKAALHIDAKNYLAYQRLGKVSETLNQWKKALEYYNEAIRAHGTHVPSYIAISKIYIQFYNFKQALSYLDKAKRIQPRSAAIYATLGNYYENKEDIDRAITEYKKAIALDSENFEWYFKLGKLHQQNKDYDTAQKYFSAALKLDPDRPNVRVQISKLYFERGLKAQSVDFLKKLIQAYPLSPIYYSGLGDLYVLGGNIDFAKESYLKALNIDDEYIEALHGLAQVYEQTEQTQKAVQTYEKIIKLDVSNAKWYFLLASVYAQTGNYKKAFNQFILTTQINYNYPLSHYSTGQMALTLGHRRRAESEFKKEIKIHPHLKKPYVILANLYYEQGQQDAAQDNYKMVIRLDPNYTDAYLKLGNIHVIRKRYDTAIEFFKTALEKNPNEGYAYLQLGRIYKALDRKSDAIAAFENYLRVNPGAPNINEIRKTLQLLKKY